MSQSSVISGLIVKVLFDVFFSSNNLRRAKFDPQTCTVGACNLWYKSVHLKESIKSVVAYLCSGMLTS